MEAPVIGRRDGVRLDPHKLDAALSARGVTAQDLSLLIGVHAVVISRARHGHAIRESTFRKLAAGLAGIPLLEGAEALLPDVGS